MEEQMNQPLLPQERLTSGVLKNFFIIPGKAKMHIISNALLVGFPFCLLILGADLTYACVMVKILATVEALVEQDHSGPEAKKLAEGIIKSVWLLLGIQILSITLFCIISFSSLVMLRVVFRNFFSKLGDQWRIKRVIAWFHATFLIVFMDIIVLVSVGLISGDGKNVAVIVLGLIFVALGTLTYLYLAAVWMFGIVMSITEIHSNELVVCETFDELTQVRWLQGFVLMMLASVFSILVAAGFAIIGLYAQFEKGIIVLCYVCLLKFFMLVLYRVYSYECKRRNQEQANVEVRSGYSVVMTSEI